MPFAAKSMSRTHAGSREPNAARRRRLRPEVGESPVFRYLRRPVEAASARPPAGHCRTLSAPSENTMGARGAQPLHRQRDGPAVATMETASGAMFERRTDLTSLLAVAETGKIVAAAERLAISQPALSRTVARLEARFRRTAVRAHPVRRPPHLPRRPGRRACTARAARARGRGGTDPSGGFRPRRLLPHQRPPGLDAGGPAGGDRAVPRDLSRHRAEAARRRPAAGHPPADRRCERPALRRHRYRGASSAFPQARQLRRGRGRDRRPQGPSATRAPRPARRPRRLALGRLRRCGAGGRGCRWPGVALRTTARPP